MSSRPTTHSARVLARTSLSPHLVRVVLGEVDGFESTGIPDEWVGLVVPGQFQSRYYTVRSWDGAELVLDVVVHDEGLVTEWVRTDCVGDQVTLTAPKGSFALPDDARWAALVGDLTALPAIARIRESRAGFSGQVLAVVESPDGPVEGYTEAEWVSPPAAGGSALAALVESRSWPPEPGYFWMAGESAQMREIRRHVRRALGWDSRHHDLMGYWSGARARQARAVDPGPIYARGKAEGRSDEEIWAAYDEARRG
ncbi:MAG: siderophore-interacting protein [Marmoricola sp.]